MGNVEGKVSIAIENNVGYRKQKFTNILYKQRYLLMMSVPVVIWLLIFSYIPLWGWSLAFFKYTPALGFGEMEWVGLKYFQELLGDPRFYTVFRNTVIMSLLNVSITGFLCPIIFALMLNEVRHVYFKRSIQTISYLPHFVSWVVVAGMFIQLLSPATGALNGILMSLNIIEEPIHFMAEPKYFYSIITVSNTWKEVGWNAIIFIAAIAGIDQEQYEAAAVDGAGRFRRMWNITLPGIRSTIVILLIMNIGAIVGGGFEKQFLFSNALNQDVAEVIDMYVLKYGVAMTRFSYGTAVGMFTSVISLSLVLFANKLSKKLTDESLI